GCCAASSSRWLASVSLAYHMGSPAAARPASERAMKPRRERFPRFIGDSCIKDGECRGRVVDVRRRDGQGQRKTRCSVFSVQCSVENRTVYYDRASSTGQSSLNTEHCLHSA